MRFGARDRNRADAVEVERDGRLGSFDGNHSSKIQRWIIPQPGKKFTGLDDDDLDVLVNWMAFGDLSWVVFPIDND